MDLGIEASGHAVEAVVQFQARTQSLRPPLFFHPVAPPTHSSLPCAAAGAVWGPSFEPGVAARARRMDPRQACRCCAVARLCGGGGGVHGARPRGDQVAQQGRRHGGWSQAAERRPGHGVSTRGPPPSILLQSVMMFSASPRSAAAWPRSSQTHRARGDSLQTAVVRPQAAWSHHRRRETGGRSRERSRRSRSSRR